MERKNFEERLRQHAGNFHPVIPYKESDRFLLMDFTLANTELDEKTLTDTGLFSDWVNHKLEAAGANYGIGGYNEHRTIYSRSDVFGSVEDKAGEPRRLHLGIDIWGPARVAVMAPLPGKVHSYAFNDAYGDYGATLILEHQLEGLHFHTLYGHLSLDSISNKHEGQEIGKGEIIGAFGNTKENGHWPPHLHFQVIIDMQGKKGDYPGVCKLSERDFYLANCPDPDVLLNMMDKVL